jgi:5-methylcytosine-specific restriction endonuclease McrA
MPAKSPEALARKKRYRAEWTIARHRRRLAEARAELGGRCVECGTTEDLEFDHIDPSTKRFKLSQGGGYCQAVWDAEVAKCQLLCAPHHHDKTKRDAGGWRCLTA